MLVYFMLGVICCDWKSQLSWINKIPSTIAYLLFVGGEIAMLMDILGGQVTTLLPYIGIGAVMALARDLEKWHHERKSLLMIVAASSYIIYLFHTTFEGFAKAVLHKIPIFADTSNEMLFIVNVTVVVFCGVVCPIILHRYVLNKSTITENLFGLK